MFNSLEKEYLGEQAQHRLLVSNNLNQIIMDILQIKQIKHKVIHPVDLGDINLSELVIIICFCIKSDFIYSNIEHNFDEQLNSIFKNTIEVYESFNKPSLEIISDLSCAAIEHDESKLIEPEKSGFIAAKKHLSELVYGSGEYFNYIKEGPLSKIIKLHYAENEHHPEHYPNGIAGMSIVDIIEMFCDWEAATHRMKDGNILDSIEINSKRFRITESLKQILINSV